MQPSRDVLNLAKGNFETGKLCDMDFDRDCPYTWGMDVPAQRGVFDRNDLVVLAGYPSCGKTEFTYFLAKKNADRKVKVAYITLELTPQYLLERLARKKAGVNKKDWQEKNYTEQQKEIMKKSFHDLWYYPNIKLVCYKESPTISDLETTIRNMKKDGYDLFFIDNLGKISGDPNEVARYTEITNRLQSLKNEIGTCIFLLHHMSKPGKGQEYKQGGLSGIRGSQKIIDNATMVLELWRDLEPDRNVEETTLALLKDTMDGHTGKITLSFNKGDYAVQNDNGGKGYLTGKKPDSKKGGSGHSGEDYSGRSDDVIKELG